MSYAISGNSVCQVTLRSKLFNQTCINTFHYRLDLGGGTVSDGAAFLADFNDALGIADTFYSAYRGCLPAACAPIEVDLQWIDLDRFVKRSFGVGPIGLAGHVPTTANLSSDVMLRADISDRRSVGVKHIPGLGGNAVAAGLVQVDLLDLLTELGSQATLPVTVGTRTMTPIIFGRARAAYTDKHGVVHPGIPKSYRPVTQGLAETTARVMRRRTVGVGI